MNIALIGPGIMPIPPKGWGGVEHLIWNFSQQLKKVGDEVTVRVREIDNRGRINLTLRGIPQNGDNNMNYPQPTPTPVAPLM